MIMINIVEPDLKVCNHFEYTGNARGSTLQTTAQDQYKRPDLKTCNHFEYTGMLKDSHFKKWHKTNILEQN